MVFPKNHGRRTVTLSRCSLHVVVDEIEAIPGYKYQSLPGCAEHIFNIGNDAAGDYISLRVFFFERLITSNLYRWRSKRNLLRGGLGPG